MQRFAVGLLVVLAGCVTPPLTGTSGLDTHEVGLSVRDASVEPGRCFDGAPHFGEECHIVRLRVDNSQNDVEVKLKLSWSAADAEGGGASRGDLVGPDHVAPGTTVDVTVRFTVPTDSPPLVTVHFSGFPNARGQASVPPY